MASLFYYVFSISLLRCSFSYYLVYDNTTDYNWIEAQTYCNETYGTNLATAVNQTQLDRLISMRDAVFSYNVYMFIGLNDRNQEGVYEWISGEPCDAKANGTLCVTYWKANEPSGGSEDCVELIYPNIDDISYVYDMCCECKRNNQFFCDPRFHLVYDSSTTWNWYEAQDYCNATYGTNLATATTQTELNELIAMRDEFGDKTQEAFIGLNDLNKEDGWRWISNKPCDEEAIHTKCVTYWKTGEPNNYQGTENCAELAYDPYNYALDMPCDTGNSGYRRNQFFCDAIQGSPPTAEPTIEPTSSTNNPTNIPTTYTPTTSAPSSNPTYTPTRVYPSKDPTISAPSSTPTDKFVTSSDSGQHQNEEGNDSFVTVLVILVVVVVICVFVLIFMIYYKAKKQKSAEDVMVIDKNKMENEMTMNIGSQVANNDKNQDGLARLQPGSVSSFDQEKDTQNESAPTTNEINEIKNWLSSTRNLTQYVDNFVDHGYTDLGFIQKITDKSDLKDIGITIPAHQVTILDSIKTLNGNHYDQEYNQGEEGGVSSKNTLYPTPVETNGNYVEAQRLDDDEFIIDANTNDEMAETAGKMNTNEANNDVLLVNDINKIYQSAGNE